MSRTLLPLAGFEVTFNGRFWVTTEAEHELIRFLLEYLVLVGCCGAE
jgi:hypothetical protein